MLVFGGLTGNLGLCIGWIVLSLGNFIPIGQKTLSAVAVIVVAIIRKIFRSGGTN